MRSINHEVTVDRRRTSSSLRCMILRALAALLGTRDVDLLNNGHYYSLLVLTTVELRTVCSNPGLSHHRSTIRTSNIGRSAPFSCTRTMYRFQACRPVWSKRYAATPKVVRVACRLSRKVLCCALAFVRCKACLSLLFSTASRNMCP